jgi:hypothetical protein
MTVSRLSLIGTVYRMEISRPAGENAGLRDDPLKIGIGEYFKLEPSVHADETANA